MIRAEIIAIGSELLTPFRIDTNSLFLTRSMEEHGIKVIGKTVVGDDMTDLVRAFAVAFDRADLIVCSGGLGPTVDDITREALANHLRIPMNLDQEILTTIEKRFRSYGLRMPEINRKQAMVPEGGRIMPNPNGTAPGLFLETGGKQVFLLPGPPFELEPMWNQSAIPLLKKDAPIRRMIFRIAMLGESRVDEMLKPVSNSLKTTQYTILASPAEIEVHLVGPESSRQEMEDAAEKIREILGKHIYAESLIKLEEVVGKMLLQARKKVATAESCTGGLLASRITDIAGSSAYFERGVVVYSNQAKTELVGVPAETIAQHGAVSAPTASALAEGIRKLAEADFGIGITGIAGPDGGTPEKPVGTVFIGLADQNGTTAEKFSFMGKRDKVKFMSTQAALNLLRLKLMESKG